MTPEGENALQQLSKCLDFCQALASKGQHFNLNLTLGTAITISLETRENQPSRLMEKMEKKKKSPSTLKRNLKRKEEFQKKKCSENTKESSEKEAPPQKKSFDCDQCDQIFSSEKGLKIHIGKTHKVEILRENHQATSLKASPSKEPIRECECCGDTMSPHHQCEESDDDEPPEPIFSCEYCEEKVKSRKVLIIHTLLSHKIDIKTEEEVLCWPTMA